MVTELVNYGWAAMLILACCACWIGSVFSLPGNWAIVAATATYVWLVPEPNISWTSVGVLFVLAGIGEAVESLAGAASVAKLGGSRRSAIISLLGTVVGSVIGVVVGLPVPIIGPAIAAIVGGAVGAFFGAVTGEHWKGRSFDQQLKIGRVAFWGRVIGTVGKLAIGLAMIVITTADVLF